MKFKTLMTLMSSEGKEFIYEHIKSVDDRIDNISCMQLPKGSIKKLLGRDVEENVEIPFYPLKETDSKDICKEIKHSLINLLEDKSNKYKRDRFVKSLALLLKDDNY